MNPEDVLPPVTAYYVMRVGSLPLVPFHPPGDPTLADAVAKLAGKHHAVLLANHGPVVAGTSLDAAVGAIEELEETARLFLLLRQEKTRWLTPAQVAGCQETLPARLIYAAHLPPSWSAMCWLTISSKFLSAAKPMALARAVSNLYGQPATMRWIWASGSQRMRFHRSCAGDAAQAVHHVADADIDARQRQAAAVAPGRGRQLVGVQQTVPAPAGARGSTCGRCAPPGRPLRRRPAARG